MSVAYERTGGFAGMRQRLEISPDKVKVTDRRAGTRERALAQDESSRLDALVKKAKAVPFPARGGGRGSDSFTIKLWFDEEQEPRATLSTHAVPVEESDGTPWGDLITFLDKILTAELDAAKA
jgi:hypothetical protein